MGHQIVVISTKKLQSDGLLTEALPEYVSLMELNGFGGLSKSLMTQLSPQKDCGVALNRSSYGNFLLRVKRAVAKRTGQLIDHRLFFAFQFIYPWLNQSVQQELRSADIVMSTSPPWPVHLAGLIVKKRFLKPWVADYRDQFSGSHIQSGSPWFQRREINIERWFLKSADAVVAISEPMKEYYQQFHSSVFCIENGYEESLFEKALSTDSLASNLNHQSSKELIIRYLGTISSDRIPMALFKALINANQKCKKPIIAEFYGDSSLLLNVVTRLIPEVKPFVKLYQQLPYSDAIRSMRNADALFFIETSDFSSHSSRGVLTTKLFEYLAARKPIIAEISDKALTASYIKRAGVDLVISENVDQIEAALIALCDGNFHLQSDNSFIRGLSRRLKAVELEKLLREIVASNSSSRSS